VPLRIQEQESDGHSGNNLHAAVPRSAGSWGCCWSGTSQCPCMIGFTWRSRSTWKSRRAKVSHPTNVCKCSALLVVAAAAGQAQCPCVVDLNVEEQEREGQSPTECLQCHALLVVRATAECAGVKQNASRRPSCPLLCLATSYYQPTAHGTRAIACTAARGGCERRQPFAKAAHYCLPAKQASKQASKQAEKQANRQASKRRLVATHREIKLSRGMRMFSQ
jgi:hypothetical protein